MNRSPAWYAAILLGMLAVLMFSHLAMLFWGTWECDQLAQIGLDYLQRRVESGDPPNSGEVFGGGNELTECSAVEDEFNKAVAQYLSVILALLTGAGFAAGAARVQDKRNGDGPK